MSLTETKKFTVVLGLPFCIIRTFRKTRVVWPKIVEITAPGKGDELLPEDNVVRYVGPSLILEDGSVDGAALFPSIGLNAVPVPRMINWSW